MTDTYTQSTDEGFNFDFDKVKRIIVSLVTDPKSNWSSVQNEYGSVKGLYLNFILPLVAFSAVINIIKMSVVGIDIPMMGTHHVPMQNSVISSIVMIVVSCLMYYVGSFILVKIASMFEGNTDNLRTLRLIAFSSSINAVASVVTLVPWIGFLLSFAAAIYGLYIFYQGITPLTGVPENQRIKFAVVSFVVMVVVGVIFSMIFMPLQMIGGAV